MDFNRSLNAKRSVISGFVVKVFSVIVPFIMRTIIIYTLGNLYLGLGSLFSSILSALSLAELGVGSAMVFSMYKPVADNDIDKICALLNVYKKTYLIIGTFITVVGLGLLPFLPYLIKGDYPADINIYVLYIIQLISTVSGYFIFAYKGSILTAYQRADIINYVTFFTEIVMYGLQVVSLLVFRNYYAYACLILLRSVVYSLIIFFVVNKKYPRLKAKGSISKSTRNEIVKKIGALTGHKVAEVVLNSTDNILISMFIGLDMVTIYNNYFYVVTAISSMLMMAFSGLISIVGNYLIKESAEKVNNLFSILNYLNALVVSVCCSCFITMYQPFISIWTGENSLLPMTIVILFVVYFYLLRIRTVIILFSNAAGIWEKDLIKAYIMTAVNLIIDVVLIQKIGVSAALISTIVSLIFAYVYEIIIIHKYVLKMQATKFIILNVVYAVSTLLACVLSDYFISYLSKYNYLIQLLGGAIISVIISIICFIGLTVWSKESRDSFKYVKAKFIH